VVIEYDLLKWWADVRKDHPNWKIFFPANFAIITGHSIPGTYARRVFVAATGESLWRNPAYFSEGTKVPAPDNRPVHQRLSYKQLRELPAAEIDAHAAMYPEIYKHMAKKPEVQTPAVSLTSAASAGRKVVVEESSEEEELVPPPPAGPPPTAVIERLAKQEAESQPKGPPAKKQKETSISQEEDESKAMPSTADTRPPLQRRRWLSPQVETPEAAVKEEEDEGSLIEKYLTPKAEEPVKSPAEWLGMVPCPKCGKPLLEGSISCLECGTTLEDDIDWTANDPILVGQYKTFKLGIDDLVNDNDP
jgi:hypothetical protein